MANSFTPGASGYPVADAVKEGDLLYRDSQWFIVGDILYGIVNMHFRLRLFQTDGGAVNGMPAHAVLTPLDLEKWVMATVEQKDRENSARVFAVDTSALPQMTALKWLLFAQAVKEEAQVKDLEADARLYARRGAGVNTAPLVEHYNALIEYHNALLEAVYGKSWSQFTTYDSSGLVFAVRATTPFVGVRDIKAVANRTWKRIKVDVL